MDVFCIDSVDIDSIEFIRDPCLVLTVSTYIVYIYSIHTTDKVTMITVSGFLTI